MCCLCGLMRTGEARRVLCSMNENNVLGNGCTEGLLLILILWCI